ncbi:MAG: DNA polymerase [Armatimonadetes bacterium]|nr:DNA polymerase [Armatimonadota bacterium]
MELSLRYLFLDLNSYFASVEQQEHPELRGKPIAVVPVEADSSFVIAASYPAKAFGVKTGTRIGDAKRMCPGLQCVQGNHSVYMAYHQRILEVVENVLPIEEVCSVDEMRFRLLGEERTRKRATEIAHEFKRVLREQVGECILCSIGVAPNPFLAKVASDMQKPDGLVILERHELPEALLGLELMDFAGINKRMAARLKAAGIFTTADMLARSEQELREAFGSVVGARWYHLLRGTELEEKTRTRQSLGHSHVLAPDLRNDDGVYKVMLRLIHKATARLRAHGLHAGHISFGVQGMVESWEEKLHHDPTQNTDVVASEFAKRWARRNFKSPRMCWVNFHDLKEPNHITPSLFGERTDSAEMGKAVDAINQKFGKNKVYLAALGEAKDAAEERIAFNKTWLFSEGKGDHETPGLFEQPEQP